MRLAFSHAVSLLPISEYHFFSSKKLKVRSCPPVWMSSLPLPVTNARQTPNAPSFPLVRNGCLVGLCLPVSALRNFTRSWKLLSEMLRVFIICSLLMWDVSRSAHERNAVGI